MTFGEKVKFLRKQHKYTQQELADKLGVSLRTITNYESGDRYPQRREIYLTLGEILNVNPNYLIIEEDKTNDIEKSPLENINVDAKRIISEVNALFAGGQLSSKDKDAVMRALQEAYWDTKELNNQPK